MPRIRGILRMGTWDLGEMARKGLFVCVEVIFGLIGEVNELFLDGSKDRGDNFDASMGGE